MRHSLFVLCVLALVFACSALGQDFRASITGTVVDPSGAAIPAATVAAKNLDTHAQVATKSAMDGNYVLTQLPPGPYELAVEAAGFRTYKRSGITLSVGDKAVLRIGLEMGLTTESVTVNAELTGVEQNQSILGQLMDNKKVSELPLNGRQVYQLLQLSAGVLFTSASPTGTRAWDVGGQYVIQGSFQNTSAFLLDGAANGVQHVSQCHQFRFSQSLRAVKIDAGKIQCGLFDIGAFKRLNMKGKGFVAMHYPVIVQPNSHCRDFQQCICLCVKAAGFYIDYHG